MAKYKKGQELKCEVCSNTFKYIGNTSGRFCSRECYKEGRKQGRLQKCENCGEDFDAGYGPQERICCSYKCMGEYRYKKKIKKCEGCGGDMHQKGKKLKYCSVECYAKTRRGKPRDEKTKAKIKKNGRGLPLGTKRPDVHGYVNIKIEDGWMKEHRFVIEEHIGRKLNRDEHVHHKNGLRDDNRLENLELWTTDYSYRKNTHPQGIRIKDYIKHQIETLPKLEQKEIVDHILDKYINTSDESIAR